MLPPTFVVDDCRYDVLDFVCDNCNARIPSETIQNIVTQNERELISAGNNISKYKEIIQKQRKIFHENHGIILTIKSKIAILIMSTYQLEDEEYSTKLLIECINYCKEVAQNLKLLTPCEFDEMYPFDTRLLHSFFYFVYFIIYFIYSHDKGASNPSISIVFKSDRIL